MKPDSSRKTRWACRCRAGNSRETLPLPLFDLGLIAFAGVTTRLLRRPVQACAQKAADMIVMKRDAEKAADEFPDPGAGPQFRVPAVGFGALQEESFQAVLLVGGQARRRPAMGLGGQAVGLPRQLEPAVNGTTVNTQDPGDRLGAFPVANRLHRLTASPFRPGLNLAFFG